MGSLLNFSVSLFIRWDDRSTFVFKMQKAHRAVKVLVAQSCLTLCDPMDYSLPGSSVHGILQVRILEWVVIPDPGIKPGSPTLQADSLLFEPPGKPSIVLNFQMNIGITSMFVKILYSQATSSLKSPYSRIKRVSN